MKNILRFNESTQETMIYSVIVYDSGYIDEEQSVCFRTKIDAADYFIKWVNEVCEKEFEPMKDENGDRFFTSADENEDFEKAIKFVEKEQEQSHGGYEIYLTELKLK